MTPKEALNEEMLRLEIENIKLRIQIERLSQVISQFAISQPMKPIIIECSDEVIKKALTELEVLKARDKPMKTAYTYGGAAYCPNCERHFVRNPNGTANAFCGNCGQRLDWSDDK
jgi:hypothetical protein